MWACCLVLDLIFCILDGSVLYDSVHNSTLVCIFRKLFIVTLCGFVHQALLRFLLGIHTLVDDKVPEIAR